jgi:hypothetical protein
VKGYLTPNTCFEHTIGHDNAAGAAQTFIKLIQAMPIAQMHFHLPFVSSVLGVVF